jgi:hypothetical protein
MSTRPRITRVVLENFKNIAFCDVRLGPLTFLVGPNGSGKSNFLKALQYVSASMRETDVFRFGALLRRGAPGGSRVGVRIEMDSPDWSAVYTWRDGPDDPRGHREECHVYDREGHECASYLVAGSQVNVAGMTNPPQHTKPGTYLPSLSGYPEFVFPYEALANQMAFYDFDMIFMRNPQTGPRETGRPLDRNGTFLGYAIDRLINEQPVVWARIIEYLRAINPAVQNVTITKAADFLIPVFGPFGFGPLNVSDGTIRALAALVALFQSVDGGPTLSFVGIEEPETGIHPGALAVLLDAMQEASLSVQVAATSHSAELLDNKDIPTESLLAFEEIEGVAHIGPVDAAGREMLKRRLSTPGELMRMGQLHPELNGDAASDIESILFSPTLAQ